MTKKHIRACSQGSFLEEAAVTVCTNLAAVTLCHLQEGFVSLASRTTRGALWPLLPFVAEGQVFSHEMPICPPPLAYITAWRLHGKCMGWTGFLQSPTSGAQA